LQSENYRDSVNYVQKNFTENFGIINDIQLYPTDFKTSRIWFNDFLITRFDEFGIYEDAVLIEESIINHSVLSPLINSGLLNPKYVVKNSLEFYKKNKIPINSTEGFIRQIIGWREFIRGVYVSKGSEERTKNYWNFNRKIPKSFYDGNTGIDPIDDTIKKVEKSAYGNHIERLMILGNFMVLCEFDPNEVYKWFMEVFIDSYDWVMVPNVYGMSQFADGGLMSTKPYISSSNYIIKMSDYKKGEWSDIWDGLFWSFMDKQRDFFKKNPRMRMLISSFDKMDSFKKEKLLMDANNFLIEL
jgi:deoxyribodipyrimidine photolyase-related protein